MDTVTREQNDTWAQSNVGTTDENKSLILSIAICQLREEVLRCSARTPIHSAIHTLTRTLMFSSSSHGHSHTHNTQLELLNCSPPAHSVLHHSLTIHYIQAGWGDIQTLQYTWKVVYSLDAKMHACKN